MDAYLHWLRVLAALTCLTVASAAWPQAQPPGPNRDAPATAEAPNPEPQTRSDEQAPGRNVWSTPLGGIGKALGLTALFTGMGMNESVAAALSGALLAILIVALALVAWQFVRRRKVLEPGPHDTRHKPHPR